jgi:hypothetical protein
LSLAAGRVSRTHPRPAATVVSGYVPSPRQRKPEPARPEPVMHGGVRYRQRDVRNRQGDVRNRRTGVTRGRAASLGGKTTVSVAVPPRVPESAIPGDHRATKTRTSINRELTRQLRSRSSAIFPSPRARRARLFAGSECCMPARSATHDSAVNSPSATPGLGLEPSAEFCDTLIVAAFSSRPRSFGPARPPATISDRVLRNLTGSEFRRRPTRQNGHLPDRLAR